MDGDISTLPRLETNPKVGFSPVIPQKAAGLRIEPLASVPRAAVARPAATATAEPLLEPPGTRSWSHGFGSVPKCGLAAVPPMANSYR